MMSWFRLSHRASLAAVALFALGGCLAEAAGEDDGVDGADDALTSSSACVVTYDVTSQGSSSFTTKVTIQNTGSKAYSGWHLDFTFPGTQQITTINSAKKAQKGRAVEVTNGSANGSVPAEGTTSFQFTASGVGQNNEPAAFFVNGSKCSRGTVNGGGAGGGNPLLGSGSSGATGP